MSGTERRCAPHPGRYRHLRWSTPSGSGSSHRQVEGLVMRQRPGRVACARLSVLLVLAPAAACGGAAFTAMSTGGDADGSMTSGADSSAGAGDSSAADRAPPSDRTPMTFACGSASCIRGVEVCCVDPNLSTSCGNGSCPTGSARLACASSATCGPGLVCCIRKQSGSSESQCAAACGQGEAQLCNAQHSASECAATAPCSTDHIDSWNLAPPFGTCGGIQG